MNFDFITFILNKLFSKQSTSKQLYKTPEPISKPLDEPELSNELSSGPIYILPNIENIIDKLPKHPTRKWNQRKLTDIKKIIVHHSDTTATDDGLKNIKQIAQYHISPNHISPQGCPAICYSLIIDKAGNIYQTNNFEDVTWHCKGQNANALGVCLLEGGNGQVVNEKQLVALENLLNYLMNILKLIRQYCYGHWDFSSTECPGNDIYSWLQEWKKK